MSRIKNFIANHTKGIVITLAAIICVALAVIGGTVYLHNKNKVDKPTVATTSTSKPAQKADEKKDGEVTSEDKDSEKTEVTTAAEKDEEKTETEDKKEAKTEDKNKDKKETKKDSSDSEKSSAKANDKSEAKADTSSGSKSEASNSSSSSSSSSNPSSSSISSSGKSGVSSSSSGSSSGKEQKTTEAQKPSSGGSETACVHNWVWATKTVHHDAVYKSEPKYGEEWDEPVYRDAVQCLECGGIYNSVQDYYNSDTCGSRNTTSTQVIDHYEHHDAEIICYHDVLVSEAYDEEGNDYQYCSKCGARK